MFLVAQVALAEGVQSLLISRLRVLARVFEDEFRDSGLLAGITETHAVARLVGEGIVDGDIYPFVAPVVGPITDEAEQSRADPLAPAVGADGDVAEPKGVGVGAVLVERDGPDYLAVDARDGLARIGHDELARVAELAVIQLQRRPVGRPAEQFEVHTSSRAAGEFNATRIGGWICPSAEPLAMPKAPARFDRSVTTAALLVGDLAIIVLQLSAGLLTHGEDPLAAPGYTAATVVPFLVGWLLAAPMLGAYTTRVRESFPETVLSVGLAWIVAALIGVGLRATPWLQGSAPAAFVVVTVGTGLATLLPWRLLATALTR